MLIIMIGGKSMKIFKRLIILVVVAIVVNVVTNKFLDYSSSSDDNQRQISLLRKAMVNRDSDATIHYVTKGDESKTLGKTLFEKAVAYTGVADEGDYIKYNLSSYRTRVSYVKKVGEYQYDIDYHFEFYTNLKQEQAVATRVKAVAKTLEGKSDYQKIKYINDYITSHVSYRNIGTLAHTAYGALHYGKAVCQGYTLLMYRMLLACGIDNRMIVGTGFNGERSASHSWNIIKLKGAYYNNDVTWNDTVPANRYFLRGNDYFIATHQSDKEYQSTSFRTSYPLSNTDYV
ncbi:MAG TPA: hypothetical protein DIC33_04210 [Kandleria vitulina]|nr:hypothetical protein [Kandleria vitulina]HCY53282.1 hypothetical protein [Kandleria vitulina]